MIQFWISDAATRMHALRLMVWDAAWKVERGDDVRNECSMIKYFATEMASDIIDRAMQVHGGLGYSRYKPFEHIYRHHRRYRITEGTEEIQMRRVAGYMFNFMKQSAPKGVEE